jgi:diacylglycerol kinase family enzyme
MKIVLVYNPQSGSSLSAAVLRRKCRAAGIEIQKLIAIKDGFENRLTPFIEKGDIIGVIGGDGTVSAVAGLVADTKATLLPLPGGTLNHFTKDLGVSQDIDEALRRATDAKPRLIDVGCVNDTIFINNSSLGIYPASLLTREEFETRVGKWPAAVAASLRALVRMKTYNVIVSGHAFATPFIFVGNNRYRLDKIGGTERTHLDKGVLTVYMAKTRSRRTLLKIALFALVGGAERLPEFEVFHPTHLTIDTKRPTVSVSHDGEVSKMTMPLDYEIKKKALRVL